MIKAALSGEPIEILDHLVGILGPRNARDNCLAAISPEVIDTPLGAKKRYARLGYREIAPHSMEHFGRLFGFRTACWMSKMISDVTHALS